MNKDTFKKLNDIFELTLTRLEIPILSEADKNIKITTKHRVQIELLKQMNESFVIAILLPDLSFQEVIDTYRAGCDMMELMKQEIEREIK